MKVTKYNIFTNDIEVGVFSRTQFWRISMPLLLMLFITSTVVFGQNNSEKPKEGKKTAGNGNLILEEILKNEEKSKNEEKQKALEDQNAKGKMTSKRLQELLELESKTVTGQLGNWRVDYKGIPFFVITDERANRMRIISPIIEDKKLTVTDLKTLMEANFDKALDAKYSIYQEVLWATYAHPLGELTEGQFKDALKQVFNLVRNYGTSYSSTGVIFGTGTKPEDEQIN